MPYATGTQAAAAMSAPSGTFHVVRAETAKSSACEPWLLVATTRSPTARSVTSSATSTIVPAAW